MQLACHCECSDDVGAYFELGLVCALAIVSRSVPRAVHPDKCASGLKRVSSVRRTQDAPWAEVVDVFHVHHDVVQMPSLFDIQSIALGLDVAAIPVIHHASC